MKAFVFFRGRTIVFRAGEIRCPFAQELEDGASWRSMPKLEGKRTIMFHRAQEEEITTQRREAMPKMKTLSGAKKRFKPDRHWQSDPRKHAYHNHILTKKHKSAAQPRCSPWCTRAMRRTSSRC